jgi:pimeloyl-ACP methyl ester carboxylesterase
VTALQTDPNIKQLIFVMHGIRDESTWPAEVKRSIERQIGDRAATIKIIPPLYRRFTMLPFLLYWDRQYNVRWFMDQYTQAKAMYPNLETMDFIGHSNGTYILASALQQYPVLKVRNVFFAGSVVPVHYNWAKPISEGRVTGRVWNICADGDWVVAIFPQLFQQISDWLKIEDPQPGLLDIGSAGFHGFRVAVGTTEKVFNLKYISGGRLRTRHGGSHRGLRNDRPGNGLHPALAARR